MGQNPNMASHIFCYDTNIKVVELKIYIILLKQAAAE